MLVVEYIWTDPKLIIIKVAFPAVSSTIQTLKSSEYDIMSVWRSLKNQERQPNKRQNNSCIIWRCDDVCTVALKCKSQQTIKHDGKSVLLFICIYMHFVIVIRTSKPPYVHKQEYTLFISISALEGQLSRLLGIKSNNIFVLVVYLWVQYFWRKLATLQYVIVNLRGCNTGCNIAVTHTK